MYNKHINLKWVNVGFDTIFAMEGMKMGEFKFISTLASVKASEVILDALLLLQ